VATLLIVGEHDEPCVKRTISRPTRSLGARHIVIPGAGHLTDLKAQDAFNRAVTALRSSVRRRVARPAQRSCDLVRGRPDPHADSRRVVAGVGVRPLPTGSSGESRAAW
jgi:hypothetical protein